MEDNEKASREELSERTESIFWEIEDIIKKQQNPEALKETMEQDELYVDSVGCDRLADDLLPRFRSKFRSFFEQYECRELHFQALLRVANSEVQLERSKTEDLRKKSEAEAIKSRTLSTQVSTFSQTETELRSQLNIYVEKFKQVCLSCIPCHVAESSGTMPWTRPPFGPANALARNNNEC